MGRYRIEFTERSLADPMHSHVVNIGIVNPCAPDYPHDPTKPWMLARESRRCGGATDLVDRSPFVDFVRVRGSSSAQIEELVARYRADDIDRVLRVED